MADVLLSFAVVVVAVVRTRQVLLVGGFRSWVLFGGAFGFCSPRFGCGGGFVLGFLFVAGVA